MEIKYIVTQNFLDCLTVESFMHAKEMCGPPVRIPNDGQKRVAMTRAELKQKFKYRLGITESDPYGTGLGRSAFYEMLDDIFGSEAGG